MSAVQSISGEGKTAGTEVYDVVVVGAGFAGMYMLHKLRGQGLSVRVYEQGGDVGGTWYWNRYPGARCDVESMQYSYSFSDELQKEWNWSERYAPQPEILKYANHVADRFRLRSDIQLNVRVDRAAFHESSNTWSVTTSDGKTVTAKHVVLATGCLSNARIRYQGSVGFQGKVYHTGNWPHERIGFHRPARRCHRHRVVGDPVRAHHRRAGQPAHGVPAHGQLQRARPQRGADGGGTRGVSRKIPGNQALCAGRGAQRHLYRHARSRRARRWR
jgi:choline dehydrogenase-like flavoprotein